MELTQDQVIASIPSYLRQFVVKQHYSEYTPEHHATWRYIMRRNVDYLKNVAHEAYLEGLKKTGISIDTVPHINEMNDRLGQIGWRAVVVDGFVPPAAFMEFSEHKILVISADLRNIGNILYTPAPDIVHEAAGHAPIIADPLYAEYLQKFGQYGAKAVFSKLDYDIYEAIRYLSIIKEYPNATEEQIAEAERVLEEKTAANTEPSEAALLSRMHWWTVEYGLVGTPEDFKLYGAGLLSSVGESKACMSPEVKKIPLTVDCVNTNYDITKMQPQLFVARDFQHLLDVLEEFADQMCFRTGGAKSIQRVIGSENVGTCVYSSGIQVSGTFTELMTDEAGHEIYLKTSGPTQLSYTDTELEGHGTDYHADGYSSVVGKLSGTGKAPEDHSDGDLEALGIVAGKHSRLAFASGIVVEGILNHSIRRDGKLLLMQFSDCTVTGPKGETLFAPDWGVYDMCVGERIASVYSGSADKEKFNVYPPKSTKTTIKDEYTPQQLRLFEIYQEIRDLRDSGKVNVAALSSLHAELNIAYPLAWLPRLEILELVNKNLNGSGEMLRTALTAELEALKSHSDQLENVISAGLERLV
ncbi:MAG: aromatic amino acid hydroxylase [Balneolales bacterium]|nr:aromatic amino acid hydroxylase [Balneolales bacterium]